MRRMPLPPGRSVHRSACPIRAEAVQISRSSAAAGGGHSVWWCARPRGRTASRHLCRGSRWHWSCSPFPTVPCSRWVMDDRSVIREKALRLAVRTGAAADVEFVWAAQRQECARECFGLFDQRCPSTCCWLDRCRVLSDEPLEAGWPSHTERGDRQTGATRGSPRGRWVPACTREVRGPRGRTPPL